MNPKSDEATMFFPVNRRSFFYGAAVSAGAVLLWNSCAGTSATQDRDPLKEIKAIREKEPSDPADVQRLKDILLPWHGAPSTEVQLEAARALALHADFFVIPTYKEVFLRYRGSTTFLEHFIPLLALNYTVNPAARLKILYFLYNLSVRLTPKKTLNLSDSAIEQATSAFRFLGNIAFRNYIIKLNEALTEAHQDRSVAAYQQELQYLIGELYPPFLNVRLGGISTERFPDTKVIESWRAQLSSGSDEDKINALINLHRVSFLYFEPLLGMLKNASLELQRAIVPILGNNIAFTPDIQSVMLNYLDDKDDHLVIAAAKALRFKENLPAQDILKIMERHRKRDPALGQRLDDILLSTLVSEDAALADVFAVLVWNMFNTESSNKKDKIKRIIEIRIWYWRLSNNRKDHASYPCGPSEIVNLEYKSDFRYERNNRNHRAQLAMPSVPYDIQDLFIAFLRQIPAIASPTEKHYEDRFAQDLKDLREIYEELSSRGILFLSEANDTVRKGLIVAAARFGNALSERPSMDTDGKPTRVMGFVRRWSATKAAANNDNGANLGFEAEFSQALKVQ
jgi:hypothetical protein